MVFVTEIENHFNIIKELRDFVEKLNMIQLPLMSFITQKE